MRQTILILLVCLPALAGAAARPLEGRWEGSVQIPGRDLRLVVDLAQNSTGAWKGSIIVPGLGIKGEPLTNVVLTANDLAFAVGSSLGSAAYGPARFKGSLPSADVMAGEMSQGGNVAKFALERVAPAQVESPPRSTQVARDLEDRWIGDFELGGSPRHVTITLENHADAAATARLVVVGKQTSDLPIDLVVEDGNFLRIESKANHVAFEGRVVRESGEIRGTFEMGPFELPLVLRRASARAS
jgi:hypothetical protein